MRRRLIAAVLTLGIGVSLLKGLSPRGEAQTPFMGVSPKAIQFKPVNAQNAVGSLNMTGMIHSPNTSISPLSLTNFFHKTQQPPSFPPKIATVPAINPAQNPFQKVPANSKYVINPNPPAAGSKSIFDFPYNPFSR